MQDVDNIPNLMDAVGLDDFIERGNIDEFDKEMLRRYRDKTIIHFEKDFYSMTALTFLNENINQFKISPEKLSHNFYFLVFIWVVTNIMIGGAGWEILRLRNTSKEFAI